MPIPIAAGIGATVGRGLLRRLGRRLGRRGIRAARRGIGIVRRGAANPAIQAGTLAVGVPPVVGAIQRGVSSGGGNGAVPGVGGLAGQITASPAVQSAINRQQGVAGAPANPAGTAAIQSGMPAMAGIMGGDLTTNLPMLLAVMGGRRKGKGRELAGLIALSQGAPVIGPPIIMEGQDPQTGQVVTRYSARPGFRLVRWTMGGQEQIMQVFSPLAHKLGLVRPHKRPLISVKETEALRRSASATKKLDRAAKKAGLHVYKEARTRRAGTRRSTPRNQMPQALTVECKGK